MFKLQERTCLCGVSFKVLPTSQQYTCGRKICPEHQKIIKEKDSVLVETPWPEPKPDTWDGCVDAAKVCVVRMGQFRMIIAGLALRACEIQWGGNKRGRKGRNIKGKKTLQNFADDIGVRYNTLHEWVRIYRGVVDKLPHRLREEAKKPENYKVIRKVMEKERSDEKDYSRDHKRKLSPKKVLKLYKEAKAEPETKRKYASMLRTIKHVRDQVIGNKINFDDYQRGELTEMKVMCEAISSRLRIYLSGSELAKVGGK